MNGPGEFTGAGQMNSNCATPLEMVRVWPVSMLTIDGVDGPADWRYCDEFSQPMKCWLVVLQVFLRALTGSISAGRYPLPPVTGTVMPIVCPSGDQTGGVWQTGQLE